MPIGEIIGLSILGAGFLLGAYFVFFKHGTRPVSRRRPQLGRAPDRAPEKDAADRDIEEELEQEVGVDAEVLAEEQAERALGEAAKRETRDAEERERRRVEEVERERQRRAEAERERQRVEGEKKRKDEDRRKREEEATRAAERDAREAAERARIRGQKLRISLEKTKDGWVSKLSKLFGGRKEIAPDLFDRVEEVLLTADIGVPTTLKLMGVLRAKLAENALADADAVFGALKAECRAILAGADRPIDRGAVRPFVTLVVGVNGVGKTTTIGKLAAKWTAADRKVVVAAGDTFRAAAVEQLEVWAKRVGAECVRGSDGTDPASVVFDAITRAKAIGAAHVIADTAGRLHTRQNLVEELKKVKRVAAKAFDGAPHEVILVVDSTTGQNAIAQARVFMEALAVDGMILTKLDGTAKGGVVLGIADELKLPVRYIGIGETVDDLREFNAQEFVEALFSVDGN